MPTAALKIQEVLDHLDLLLTTYKAEDILVAFDIDMTLIQPEHPALYYPNMRKHAEIYLDHMKTLTPAQRDYTILLVTQVGPRRPVEDTTLETFVSIQKRGVKVIGFTASPAGKIDPSCEAHIVTRQKYLQEMGFDFSESFPLSLDTVVFSDLPHHLEGHPTFHKGILCSNGESHPHVNKGSVLLTWLTHMESQNYHPKVILLVDDRKKNHEDVARVLTPDIHFKGIEYQGAFAYAPEDISAQDFNRFWADFSKTAQHSA